MFKLVRIPEQIDRLVAELAMFFTLSQWVHFRTMLVSLLITPFAATVRGRSRVVAFGTHRTKHNEFLQHHEALFGKTLRFYALRLVALLIQPREPLYIIIDDSRARKRGKHVQAAFRLYDHTSQRFLWGHQFVCVTFVYRGMTIPYAIELYRSKADCQKRHLPFRKLTAIAEDLIKTMPDFGVKRVYVLADTYFASKQIIRTVRAKGYHFVSFLKSNRRLSLRGRSTSVAKMIKRRFFTTRKHWISLGKSRYATVRNSCVVPGIGEVPVVLSQKNGHRGILALFSTDVSLSTKDIVSIYRIRWSIEVLFKQTKQYLGLVAYHHRDEAAVRSHLQLVLIGHALLTHLFLTEQREKGNRFTKKLLAKFSVRETQQRIRSLVARDTIDYVKEQNKSLDDPIIEQLKSYLLAA